MSTRVVFYKASTSGIAALNALLAKQGYSEKLSTLSQVKTFVEVASYRA